MADTQALQHTCVNDDELNPTKKRYANTFHVHGLSKSINGGRNESLFWTLILLCSTLICIIIVYGLVNRYLQYNILTEITYEKTDENTFPSITICDKRRMFSFYFSYCNDNDGTFTEDLPCGVQTLKSNRNKRKTNLHKVKSNERYWDNGLFNVTHCITLFNKSCLTELLLETVTRLNHTCFTWNPNGKFSDLYGQVDIEFIFSGAIENIHHDVIAFFHDSDVTEIDLTNRVVIEPYIKYNIEVEKTLFKRLPYPFPTDCTNEKSGDIFPGKYSRRACIESHNLIKMYEQCGDTFDYVKQYIPKPIKIKYERNISIADANRCIIEKASIETKHDYRCRFPCTELNFATVSSFHRRNIKQDGNPVYRMSVHLKQSQSYHVVQEKAFLTWDQLVCQIGGFLALLTGASVISIIEIFVYIWFLLVRRIY